MITEENLTKPENENANKSKGIHGETIALFSISAGSLCYVISRSFSDNEFYQSIVFGLSIVISFIAISYLSYISEEKGAIHSISKVNNFDESAISDHENVVSCPSCGKKFSVELRS